MKNQQHKPGDVSRKRRYLKGEERRKWYAKYRTIRFAKRMLGGTS